MEDKMPEISRFYGIVVKMFYKEHNPPHIHALYGEYIGLINIKTLEMTEGDLPAKALSLVQEWMKGSQDNLLQMWETQKIQKIEPLE
jgi:hypothetical protein